MKNIRLILLTILLTGLAALPAAAADYYVDINVLVSGDGSSGSPWKYLHEAAGYTGYAPGDIIHVAAGTYSPANGEPDTLLTFSLPDGASIVGAAAGTTVIDPENSSTWTTGLTLDPCSDVTVSNLIITNCYGDCVYLDTCNNVTLSNLEASYSAEGYGINIYYGSGNTINGCEVYNTGGITVFLSTAGTITNCDVHENSGDGIDLYYGDDHIVSLCQVYNNSGNGIRLTECGNSLAVTTVSQNRIYNNTSGVDITAGSMGPSAPAIVNNLFYVDEGSMDYGIHVAAWGSTGSVSPAIYHNTIVNAGVAGIWMEQPDMAPTAPDIQYNIITDCLSGILGDGNATPMALDYNNLYNNDANFNNVVIVPGVNNQIGQDPLYVDPTLGVFNYHLSSGSPCIDAAVGSTVTIDLDSVVRSGIPDMGCYEYTSFTPTPLPVTPGITVLPTQGLVTGEDGTGDTFTVVLNSQPMADVNISLSSSDTGEGTVSPASLTFTPANWFTPRTVTVKGVDDALIDGDIAYTIIIDPAASDDFYYNGLDAPDVAVTNSDNDSADIIVDPTSGLKTSKLGGSDTFTVMLNSLPAAPVAVSLASSDTDSGLVSPEWLTFTPGDWDIPQTVTVTGQDNGIDGDVPYTIITDPAVSDDPNYNNLDPDDVGVTNVDNLPPAQPQYVFPAPFQMFAPGSTITLRGSPFYDPEEDNHMESWWRIAPLNRNAFGCEDFPDFFEHFSSSDLTEYTISTQHLVPGVVYTWIVGYKDAGSGMITWSDINEREKNTFMVGQVETIELPPVPPGLTAADFVMLCCRHYIPGDSSASAVIGDDLNGGYDSRYYRIGTYDPYMNDGGYKEYPGFSLYPGTAFWVLARNGLTIDITGIPTTTTEDVDLPLQFNSNTNNGWNMVGSPNSRSYPWGSVEVLMYDDQDPCQFAFGPVRIADLDPANSYIDIRLFEWGGSGYNQAGMLMAGYGYWVKAKQAGVFLRFPVSAQASLKNPDVLLAMAVDKIRKTARQLVSPAEALADDSDSPPAPMVTIESDGNTASFGSSSGGNCFIDSLNFK